MTRTDLGVPNYSEAPAEMRRWIEQFYPPAEWDNAADVAWFESGWRLDAVADTTDNGNVPCGTIIGVRNGVQVSAERSVGWFQLNACNFPDWDEQDLFRPRDNVGTAHMLWEERGWQPWWFTATKLGLI